MQLKTLFAAAAIGACAFAGSAMAAPSGNLAGSGSICGSGSGVCGTNVDNLGFEVSGNILYVHSITGQSLAEVLDQLRQDGGAAGGVVGQAILQAARAKGYDVNEIKAR